MSKEHSQQINSARHRSRFGGGGGFLPFFIARRYLFAKKSHNVINIISLISAIGVMIGTMALIVVMSAFNGLDDLLKSLYNTFDADIRITPVEGKVFAPTSDAFVQVRTMKGVRSFSEVLEEAVLLEYRGHQEVATMKGVDSVFEANTAIRNAMYDGEFKLHHGDLEQAVAGIGLAQKLHIGIFFVDPLFFHIPRRTGPVSLMNPREALNTERTYPAGIFEIEKSFDSQYIFVSIEFARRLLEYTNEVSAVEIQLQPGVELGKIQKNIEKVLGPDYKVRSRYQQNESLYNMMSSEKMVVYFIMLFIIVIISCNVVGSLTMLIIEKKGDTETLRSLGADRKLISRIFLLEGWMISLLGIIAGTVLGLALCAAQQQFGIIRMAGHFLVNFYPVTIVWKDVLLAVVSVAAIGFVAAWLPVYFINKPVRPRPRKN